MKLAARAAAAAAAPTTFAPTIFIPMPPAVLAVVVVAEGTV